jgi:hypothetical protein
MYNLKTDILYRKIVVEDMDILDIMHTSIMPLMAVNKEHGSVAVS